MPPQTRKSAGAKKVRRKEKKNIAQGEAHIIAPSTTRSSRSPTRPVR
jgi:hypothetical protein